MIRQNGTHAEIIFIISPHLPALQDSCLTRLHPSHPDRKWFTWVTPHPPPSLVVPSVSAWLTHNCELSLSPEHLDVRGHCIVIFTPQAPCRRSGSEQALGKALMSNAKAAADRSGLTSSETPLLRVPIITKIHYGLLLTMVLPMSIYSVPKTRPSVHWEWEHYSVCKLYLSKPNLIWTICLVILRYNLHVTLGLRCTT